VLTKVKDEMYFLDDKLGYVPFTKDVYARVTALKARI
jgi:hypothetical protein